MPKEKRHIYVILTAQNILKNYLIKNFRDEKIKITPAHAAILFLLENGEVRTMSEISSVLFLDNSTVTGLVDRLEKMNFVRRSEAMGDRRKYGVSATESGIAEIGKARGIISRINREMETGMSEADMRGMHNVMENIMNKFSRRRQASGKRTE
ncbi:MAG: MarR family transcriptional regulator [Spirochaetes bacterium]|jgi:DNA-binding MarR family transcriptional regulator|nr:MarR family transcriptional regulator [Spirochaetota bacterium]